MSAELEWLQVTGVSELTSEVAVLLLHVWVGLTGMEGFINFFQLQPTCRNYSNLMLSRLTPLELSPSSL